jgi:hypothetical protein
VGSSSAVNRLAADANDSFENLIFNLKRSVSQTLIFNVNKSAVLYSGTPNSSSSVAPQRSVVRDTQIRTSWGGEETTRTLRSVNTTLVDHLRDLALSTFVPAPSTTFASRSSSIEVGDDLFYSWGHGRSCAYSQRATTCSNATEGASWESARQMSFEGI